MNHAVYFKSKEVITNFKQINHPQRVLVTEKWQNCERLRLLKFVVDEKITATLGL